jgi:hypothetical protein
MFNKTKVKSFRFVIQKQEIDLVEDKNNLCLYSIVNVAAYNDKYNKSGVYTSNAIKFDEAITDIMIYPTHSMPPKTDISYFIGYEDKNNDVEWYPLNPERMLDLNLLYKEEMILNYSTSDTFGRWDYDRDIGKRMYYIHNLPDNTNLNSIELRAGHSQWLLERLDVSKKYNQEYPPDKKVNLSDYSRENIVTISPLDVTMTDIRCEKKWNYFVMSNFVICKDETIIEDRFFTYDFRYVDSTKVETLDIVLLVNGRQIFPKGDKYSFKLKKGENTIKIMVLFGDQDMTDVNNLKYISHNFNLLSRSEAIFAGPKMERMNYNALNKDISPMSLKHYAIKTVNHKEYIVTKFDPNYVFSPYDPYRVINPMTPTSGAIPEYNPANIYMNNSEYMRMYIKFKHMLPSTLENITNSDGDKSIRCRIMARLSTSDISVSPSIKRIKVVGV